MSSHSVIQRALYAAIDEVNLQLPPDQRLPKAPETVLFGSGGQLDSLGFVNFIVTAEDTLEQTLGQRVNLADAILSTPGGAAPRTLADLVGFIAALVEPETHA